MDVNKQKNKIIKKERPQTDGRDVACATGRTDRVPKKN